jgi:hypothetical protein
MNPYAPPVALVETAGTNGLPRWTKLAAYPFLVLGALVTSAASYWSISLLPDPSGPRAFNVAVLLAYSVLFTLGASAPWWLILPRIYQRRAPLAAVAVALVPLFFRIWLTPNLPVTLAMWAITVVETLGLVIAFAFGSRFFASRLGANNSFKPNPLRGSRRG